MGIILPITDNLFPDVLKRLGVRQASITPQLWDLSTTILPVAIVDSEVTFSAELNLVAESLASEGELNNQADASLMADTGQLNAGTYHFRIYATAFDPSNAVGWRIQQRDSTNTSDDWLYTKRANAGDPGDSHFIECTLTLDQNERVRVIQMGAAGVGGYATALIFYRQIST
jgi:hypothetical protein